MANLSIRPLKGCDLWPLLSIIGKLNIKEELKAVLKRYGSAEAKETAEEDVRQKGAEILVGLVFTACQSAADVEHDVNNLLAKLCETDKTTVENLDLDIYLGLLKDAISALFKMKGLASFLA